MCSCKRKFWGIIFGHSSEAQLSLSKCQSIFEAANESFWWFVVLGHNSHCISITFSPLCVIMWSCKLGCGCGDILFFNLDGLLKQIGMKATMVDERTPFLKGKFYWAMWKFMAIKLKAVSRALSTLIAIKGEFSCVNFHMVIYSHMWAKFFPQWLHLNVNYLLWRGPVWMAI